MTSEDSKKPEGQPERVIRGGDGAVIGYWFPEDFWIYEEHLMREHKTLLERVRAMPIGLEYPNELWQEMRRTFEAFAQSLSRKYTGYDTTNSTVSVGVIARGGNERGKVNH